MTSKKSEPEREEYMMSFGPTSADVDPAPIQLDPCQFPRCPECDRRKKQARSRDEILFALVLGCAFGSIGSYLLGDERHAGIIGLCSGLLFVCVVLVRRAVRRRRRSGSARTDNHERSAS